MNSRVWAMLITLSVLWGGSFFFIGIAVSGLPPLTIAALRVSLAAITLWIVAFAMGLRLPSSMRTWWAFIVMGLLNNAIPFSLIIWGQMYIASGLASILNATTPLFTVVVAGILLADERLSAKKIAGVIIGFVGVVVMLDVATLIEGTNDNVIAQLAILVAALSYAFAGVYGRRFKTMGINPIIIASGQVTGSSLILIPLALLIERPLAGIMPDMAVCGAIVGLAVMSTALAYMLYFRILASAGATNLSLTTFLVPVSAIFLGSVFLEERLELIHFIGLFGIGVGLSLIDGRLWQKRT
jgi:drug/metabolite transporter (DMT)-like permease